MNKKRFLAMLLAVLTLVGIMPLGLFAADEATATETKADRLTVEEIEAKGGKVLFYTNFDKLTSKPSDKTISSTTDKNAVFYSMLPDAEFYNVAKGYELTEDKALQKPAGFNGANTYLDLRNPKYSNDTQICPLLHDYRNSGFVIETEVKLGDYVTPGFTKFIGIDTRVNVASANATMTLVSEKGGKLYVNSNTVLIGELSKTEFTRVAVYVDIPNWKYHVYIDGVEATDFAGYSLPHTKASLITKNNQPITYTTQANESYTLKEGDYYLNGIRFPNISVTDKSTYAYKDFSVYYADYYLARDCERAELIDKIGGAENLVADINFDEILNTSIVTDGNMLQKATNSAPLSTFVDTTDFYKGYSSNVVYLQNGESSMKAVDDGNGGYAVQWTGVPGEPTSNTFFDIRLKGVDKGNTLAPTEKELEMWNRKPVVLEFDIKASETMVSSNITFRIHDGTTTGQLTGKGIGINENGEIYLGGDDTIKYKLSTTEFTKVGILIDLANNRYYMYINGQSLNTDGAPFGINNPDQYSALILGFVRMSQITPTDDYITYDNIRMYYTTPEVGYVGEKEPESDFLKNVGYQNVIADINFNSIKETIVNDKTYPVADANGAINSGENVVLLKPNLLGADYFGNSSATNFYHYNSGGQDVMTAVDDGNGGYAVKFNKPASGNASSSFFDIRYKGYHNAPAASAITEYEKQNFSKKPLVLEFDIKASDVMVKSTVNVRIYAEKDGAVSQLGGDILNINTDGTVSLSKDVSIRHQLSTTEFTRVGLYIDLANNRYYLYINGQNVDPEGAPFVANPDNYDELFLYWVRLGQYKSDLTADYVTFDNIRMYYTTPETGYYYDGDKDVGMSLKLYDDISAAIRVPGTGVTSANIAFNGKDYAGTKKEIAGKDYFVFELPRVSPHLIAENMELRITSVANSIVTTNDPISISIKDYCYKALDAAGITAIEKRLIVDTLNYAAAAQTYLGKTEGGLVNAALTPSQQLLGTTGTVEIESTNATDSSTLNYIGGIAVGLGNGIRLTLKTNAYALRVSDANGVVAEIPASSFVAGEKSGEYYAYFYGTSAAQLKKLYKFELMNGETVVETLENYSFETYAYNKLNDSTSSEELKALVRAMMTYGKAAYDYSKGGIA